MAWKLDIFGCGVKNANTAMALNDSIMVHMKSWQILQNGKTREIGNRQTGVEKTDNKYA